MNRILTACSVGFVATLLTGTNGLADDKVPAARLLVGVKSAPPFVMLDESSGHVSGFSIDFIRLIAAQMDPPREVMFRIHKNIEEHLNAVQNGEVDLGIAATSFSSKHWIFPLLSTRVVSTLPCVRKGEVLQCGMF